MSVAELPDPRVWPATSAVDAAAARLHALAIAAIGAATVREASLRSAEAMGVLGALTATEGPRLANAFATAPSVMVARHLWRLLADCERGEREDARSLRTTLVALPVIFVSALEKNEGRITQSGVLPDVRGLEALLGPKAAAEALNKALADAWAERTAGLKAVSDEATAKAADEEAKAKAS